MRHKHAIFFILGMVCLNNFAACQSIFKDNAIYLEAGGPGILNSINYDFRFHNYGDGEGILQGLGLRFGFGLSPKYELNQNNSVESVNGLKSQFLIGINTLFMQKYGVNSNIEAGINLLFASKNSIVDKWGDFKEKKRTVASINLGYRHQDIYKSNFVWRICYNPYILDNEIHHWGGISIGWVFIRKGTEPNKK